ncbi:uncharacterized protein LOC129963687 [Argiope bruennichi]|uniref:Uncharacterized protein n=1 Tax=Argiope bruennichi TaxID=94029 RepID=A0A8T0EY04_ARGBR|nr:uncharacterized protein LOC129963687 [Argiope bruennichi]XP_055934169.1 uncharacterized protein LOC129963687 [Argiope bruennichi]KAF8782447.1 hypothetical protein HNY73_012730 [Argiope bruennichi]
MKLCHFFLLGCTLGFLGTDAQLLTDRPLPIDQLLQIVWDPGALIHMWTALDQLYNIALGWRSAAKTVITLPFREGRSMDHIRFQEPRKYKYWHRQMDVPHWERFNAIYSGQPSASVQMPVKQHYMLPPPQFLVHPQDIFPPGWAQNLAVANRDDKRLRDIKHLLQTKAFLDKLAQTNGKLNEKQPNIPIPLFFSNSNGALTSNPETRLRMFLKLMKQLGDMHTSRVDFDDSKEENGYNR